MCSRKSIPWIDWLRASAMVMIVLCHLAAQSASPLGNIIAQFLNVGVEIFFIISGYLLGKKLIHIHYREWIWKRIGKIAPSYYLFLLTLSGIHLIIPIHQDFSSWAVSILGMQGLGCYLIGGEHLWFLTVLLICYLLTPFLDQLKSSQNGSRKLLWYTFAISCFFQIVAGIILGFQIGRYWFLFNLYWIAYILGSLDFSCTTLRNVTIACLSGIFAIVCRLLGHFLFDGTIWYNLFIVSITHAVLAFSILIIFQVSFHKEAPIAIKFLDKISYEMYLVHYIFIAGPLSLIHLTNFFWLNSLIAGLISLLCAFLLHTLSAYLVNLFFKRRYNEKNSVSNP